MTGVPTAHGDAQRFRVLAYMKMFKRLNNYPPTIAEMGRALDMQRTAIVWHLSALRTEGSIDYVDGNLARSLRLMDES